jgi:DNA-binding MarR family transcriptional regulator
VAASASDAELLDAFRRMLGAVQRAAILRAEYGITDAQFWVLRHIADAGHPLSVTEIARLTQTDTSAATRKCAELHRLKLLARANADSDRRKTLQRLTPKAKRLLDEIRHDGDARLLAILHRVRRDQGRTLHALLDQLAIDPPQDDDLKRRP